ASWYREPPPYPLPAFDQPVPVTENPGPPSSTTTGPATALATVTVAVAVSPPTLASTVSVGVPEGGAVYRPVPPTVPPAPVLVTDQAAPDGTGIALPNWSVAPRVNCREPLFTTAAVPGVIDKPVSVWATETATEPVAVSPAGSLTVTRKE